MLRKESQSVTSNVSPPCWWWFRSKLRRASCAQISRKVKHAFLQIDFHDYCFVECCTIKLRDKSLLTLQYEEVGAVNEFLRRAKQTLLCDNATLWTVLIKNGVNLIGTWKSRFCSCFLMTHFQATYWPNFRWQSLIVNKESPAFCAFLSTWCCQTVVSQTKRFFSPEDQ